MSTRRADMLLKCHLGAMRRDASRKIEFSISHYTHMIFVNKHNREIRSKMFVAVALLTLISAAKVVAQNTPPPPPRISFFVGTDLWDGATGKNYGKDLLTQLMGKTDASEDPSLLSNPEDINADNWGIWAFRKPKFESGVYDGRTFGRLSLKKDPQYRNLFFHEISIDEMLSASLGNEPSIGSIYLTSDVRKIAFVRGGDIWRAEIDWRQSRINNAKQITTLGVFGAARFICWAGGSLYFKAGFSPEKPLVEVNLESGTVTEMAANDVFPSGVASPDATYWFNVLKGGRLVAFNLPKRELFEIPNHRQITDHGHVAEFFVVPNMPVNNGLWIDNHVTWINNSTALIEGAGQWELGRNGDRNGDKNGLAVIDFSKRSVTVLGSSSQSTVNIQEDDVLTLSHFVPGGYAEVLVHDYSPSGDLVVRDNHSLQDKFIPFGGRAGIGPATKRQRLNLNTGAVADIPLDSEVGVTWLNEDYLIYVNTKGGLEKYGTWLLNVSTGASRRLGLEALSASPTLGASLLPDNKTLVYVASLPNSRQGALFVADLADGPARKLGDLQTLGASIRPVFSSLADRLHLFSSDPISWQATQPAAAQPSEPEPAPVAVQAAHPPMPSPTAAPALVAADEGEQWLIQLSTTLAPGLPAYAEKNGKTVEQLLQEWGDDYALPGRLKKEVAPILDFYRAADRKKRTRFINIAQELYKYSQDNYVISNYYSPEGVTLRVLNDLIKQSPDNLTYNGGTLFMNAHMDGLADEARYRPFLEQQLLDGFRYTDTSVADQKWLIPAAIDRFSVMFEANPIPDMRFIGELRQEALDGAKAEGLVTGPRGLYGYGTGKQDATDVAPPKLTALSMPSGWEEWYDAGRNGVIKCIATIGRDGKIMACTWLEGPAVSQGDPLAKRLSHLGAPHESDFASWRFSPATKNQVPVVYRYLMVFTFDDNGCSLNDGLMLWKAVPLPKEYAWEMKKRELTRAVSQAQAPSTADPSDPVGTAVKQTGQNVEKAVKDVGNALKNIFGKKRKN